MGDRLFGHGTFIGRLLTASSAGLGPAFVWRVGKPPKPKVIEKFGDGSTLIEVAVGREEAQTLGTKTVRVREVRGRVRRPGGAWSEVRLWTSLLDGKAHPALESLALYARRWEQELAYKELKVDLRASGVRQPVKSWPRVHQTQQSNGPYQYELISTDE